MKHLALKTCALMLFATPAFAARATFKDQGPASLTVSTAPNGSEHVTTVETHYIGTYYPSFNYVKAVKTESVVSNAEGSDSKVELTMLTHDQGKFGKVLWTASAEGSETKLVGNDFVGVTQYGCCGSSDITRLFNVNSGTKVEAADGDVFMLDVPNSQLPMRYVSLALDSAAPKTFKGRAYMGTVSYFTGDKIVARARIYSDLNLHPGWGASLGELKIVGLDGKMIKGNQPDSKNVTLWQNDGVKDLEKAFSGFALQATTSYDNRNESINIVFKNDTIDEAATTVTSNLAVDFVKY